MLKKVQESIITFGGGWYWGGCHWGAGWGWVLLVLDGKGQSLANVWGTVEQRCAALRVVIGVEHSCKWIFCAL